MDLALELNYKTLAELERTMTMRELGQWYRYAAKKSLPMRRTELYLAQIAFRVANAFGSAGISFHDCLFDRQPQTEQKDTAANAGAALSAIAGGVKVVRLGQRKRKA